MKFALLISGYLRSFDYNIENLKKYNIDNNDVDIYIHITKEKESKYLNKCLSYDNLINLLKFKHITISDNIEFCKEKKKNNIINQNYKFYFLNEERKKIEKIENIKYDVVFKLRPDVNINSYIHFKNLNMNNLNIPVDSKIDISKLENPEDKYICDIIAFGCPELMNKYFDFYLHLDNLIEKYGFVNETLLYYYLNNNNILHNLIDLDYLVILSLFNTIAITGDSGSGKTTLTKIIKNAFDDSFVLECDRYHKWERGDSKWENYTHLNPEANYITKMNKDVFDLKMGNNIYQVDYDHKTGKFTDKELIESKENIIICGLHSLYVSDNITNLKIYMDTDENLRIPWKIKRDITKRDYTIEKIYKQILDRKDDYKKYIEPQKEKADIIVCLYTDKIFDIKSFDKNYEPNVYLKVGVRSTGDLTKFTDKLVIEKIEVVNKFIYFYFKNIDDYEKVITTIILNIK